MTYLQQLSTERRHAQRAPQPQGVRRRLQAEAAPELAAGPRCGRQRRVVLSAHKQMYSKINDLA